MNFGKLDNIDNVNFSLPDDHPETHRFLPKLQPEEPDIYLGGTMWTIKEWMGKVYPLKTPQKNYPESYFKQFGCIELNATHYRIHPPETIQRWYNLAPEGFKFCPKFPQIITHFRRFNNCEGPTDDFLEGIINFKEKLGPSFIQLPPNYTPKHAEKLVAYLDNLPEDLPLAVEFRHADWFGASQTAEAVFGFMRDKNISAVITDTPGRRDVLHMRLTSDILIIRYNGINLHKSDYERMDEWTDKIRLWAQQGIKEVYIFMHQTNSLLTPEACIYWGNKLAESCEVDVKVPEILG
jgi:uncharacterized protein YecE (DUF72 family)